MGGNHSTGGSMSDILWTNEQLKAAGINKRRLKSLVKKLRECSALMVEMGFEVYGQSGSGRLIHESRPTHDKYCNPDFGSVVADLGERFNGGDW